MENKLIDDISILIVEDEEELQTYLQEYLQLFFKNVYVASCGEDGYAKYLNLKPNIIISDINMPNLDGLSMIKKIRKIDNDVNIIIMSAHSEQDKLLQAIELKLVTYLIKPIDSQKLKTILFDITDNIKQSQNRIYISKNIFWDTKESTLWHNLSEIELKKREAMVFELLLSDINNTFTSKDIFNHIYAEQTDKKFSEYSITSFIKRIRLKLPEKIIQNEYGLGYKIVIKN